MKWLAVEPVPTPITQPDSTYASAASATACFFSSGVITCLATLKGGKNTLFRV